jgi:hypothetical protein
MVENPVSTGQDIIPRGDAQRANPIASRPCSADLIGLPIHFASSTFPAGATV